MSGPKKDKAYHHVVSVRMYGDTVASLMGISSTEGESISGMARRFIEDGIRRWSPTPKPIGKPRPKADRDYLPTAEEILRGNSSTR